MRGERGKWIVAALLVAVIIRDIVLGVISGVFPEESALPSVWLGPRQPGAAWGAAAAVYSFVAFVVMVAAGFSAYWGYCRIVERRRPAELSRARALRELGLGGLVGAGFIVIVVGILAATGSARIIGMNPWLVAVPALLGAATAACMEELVFRGVLFRILEERLGTWLTLAATSAVFGLLHGGNPNATWVSTLTVAVTAGLVLGGAFVLTRRLWLPIGLHFGANAAQGAVLGLPVSGGDRQGLLISEVAGSTLFTGGEFGIEASMLVLGLGLVVATVFIRQAAVREHIERPAWRAPAEFGP